MLSKQERQRLHEIEARFRAEEPQLAAHFEQLAEPEHVGHSPQPRVRPRPLLLTLVLLVVLGAASTSFVAGVLVGIVVLGSTASLLSLGLLLHHVRTGR